MAIMIADRFLFCMSLRAGVILISVFEFFLCILAAGGVWLMVNKDFSQFNTTFQILSILTGIHYSLNALFSLVGFYGAIRKRATHVSDYATLLAYTLVVQILIAAAFLVVFFTGVKEKLPLICQGSDRIVVEHCIDSVNGIDALTFVVVLVPVVLEAYAFYVVRSYRVTLDAEDNERSNAAFKLSQSHYNELP
ncbi:hypothetical protein PLICRDRAFT_175159 [Plicaturopsis crispa FD-325 SS-3]|nr:hypothetical protein PLICRDRAFT_175159 [Plicaturopsis crispa FD-325 SS-3]